MTFAELDRAKGYRDIGEPHEEEFPVPAWYRQVYRIPLENLSVLDVSRACRQQIHLEHVVPLAMRLLADDPVAGHLYEGELISALINLPADDWTKHGDEIPSLIGHCLRVRDHHVHQVGRQLAGEVDKFIRAHTTAP